MTYETKLQVLHAIISQYEISNPITKQGISIDSLLKAALNGNVINILTNEFKCSKDVITRYLKVLLPFKTTEGVLTHLLSLDNKKLCKKCDTIYSLQDFYPNVSRPDGHSTFCIECSKNSRINSYHKNPTKELENNSLRKRGNTNAQPNWADKDKLVTFYANRPSGYHVDHIIPLNHPLVCGLHTIDNLQYLTEKENLSKSNKFTI